MPPIRYAGGLLDRAAKLREDDDWISAALVSDAAVAVLIHNDQNLVTAAARREDVPHAALVPLSLVREVLPTGGSTWTFLGLDGEVPVFTVDLTAEHAALPEVRTRVSSWTYGASARSSRRTKRQCSRTLERWQRGIGVTASAACAAHPRRVVARGT